MSNPEAIRTVHVYSMHTDPFAQPGSGDAGGMNVYIAQSVRAMLTLNPQLKVEVFTLNRTPQAPERAYVEDSEWGSRLVRHYIDVPAAREAAKNDLAEYLEDFAQSCVAQSVNVPDVIHAHYWLSGWAAVQAEGLCPPAPVILIVPANITSPPEPSRFSSPRTPPRLPRMHGAARANPPNRVFATASRTGYRPSWTGTL